MNEGQDEVERATPAMTTAVLVTAFAGLVWGVGTLAPVPGTVMIVAPLVFAAGVIAVGVLAFRQARADRVSFWAALGQGIKGAFGALLALFP